MNTCLAPPAVITGLAAPGQLEPICAAVQAAPALANVMAPPAHLFAAYLLVFSLNCLMEAPAYWLAARTRGLAGGQTLRQILALNLATHPLVYFAFPYAAWLAGSSLLTTVALSEAFAFGVEAAMLRGVWRYPWGTAVLASTAANFTSWQLGAVLYDAGLADLL